MSNQPQIPIDMGRTIVYRGPKGEIVVSTAYPDDDLDSIVKILGKVLDLIVVEGGEISYVS